MVEKGPKNKKKACHLHLESISKHLPASYLSNDSVVVETAEKNVGKGENFECLVLWA